MARRKKERTEDDIAHDERMVVLHRHWHFEDRVNGDEKGAEHHCRMY